MAKILVEVNHWFGKYSAKHNQERYVIEDTKEEREYLYNEKIRYSDYVVGDKEKFLSGEENIITGEYAGTEYDEKDAVEVLIITEEQHLADIEQAYQKALEEHKQLFNK